MLFHEMYQTYVFFINLRLNYAKWMQHTIVSGFTSYSVLTILPLYNLTLMTHASTKKLLMNILMLHNDIIYYYLFGLTLKHWWRLTDMRVWYRSDCTWWSLCFAQKIRSWQKTKTKLDVQRNSGRRFRPTSRFSDEVCW